MTLGGRGEGAGDGANLGPRRRPSRVGGWRGIVALSLLEAPGGRAPRRAGEATHSPSRGGPSARGSSSRGETARTRSQRRRGGDSPDGVRYEVAAGAGYGTPRMGTFPPSMRTSLKRHTGTDRRTIGATWSRNIGWNVSVLGSFRNIAGGGDGQRTHAGVNYYPGGNLSLAASYRGGGRRPQRRCRHGRTCPRGGMGANVSVERMDSMRFPPPRGEPVLAVQRPVRLLCGGVPGGEDRRGVGGNGLVRLSAYGGRLRRGDDRVQAARLQTDSFGLVSVGVSRASGYHNNQEMGRTDGRGKLFLPSLGSYYENRISIADKDVPIEYSLPGGPGRWSPPLRSGSRIPFEVKRIGPLPARWGCGGTANGNRRSTSRSGCRWKGGRSPSRRERGRVLCGGSRPRDPCGHRGTGGETLLFEMKVPATDDMIVDLGRLTCEDPRKYSWGCSV